MQAKLTIFLSAAALAQLDIDGFLRSDNFIIALAQFVSGVILQLLNALLFGAVTTG